MLELDENGKLLVQALRNGQAMLLAGAGSSASLGYVPWVPLLEKLLRAVDPTGQHKLTEGNTLDTADQILEIARKNNLEDEFYRQLTRLHQPWESGRNHLPLHESLVQLGFAGLVTTNYDLVIEHAVQAVYSTEGTVHRCRSLDLCGEYPLGVFDFLRQTPTRRPPSDVLHLHGVFDSPRRIILTGESFTKAYGARLGDHGDPLGTIEDTLHRRVIWTLLATHSLVFVGFSLRDPFFLHLLKVVREDFSLGLERVHFALAGYTDDESRQRTEAYFTSHGVAPLMYPVRKNPDGSQNHGALDDLVSALRSGVSGRVYSDQEKIVRKYLK